MCIAIGVKTARAVVVSDVYFMMIKRINLKKKKKIDTFGELRHTRHMLSAQ